MIGAATDDQLDTVTNGEVIAGVWLSTTCSPSNITKRS